MYLSIYLFYFLLFLSPHNGDSPEILITVLHTVFLNKIYNILKHIIFKNYIFKYNFKKIVKYCFNLELY